MSLTSNKRKGKANLNNKFPRNRGSADKAMASDGVYSNSRLMHAAASLVGCIVQVQVRNGAWYEGIFQTFSNEFDMVLEMPHKFDQKLTPAKGIGPAVSNLLVAFPFEDSIADKLIFRLKDIVMLQASNVDLDYAIKDNFTDTAISKFNGMITERELEPWEAPTGEAESLNAIAMEVDDDANGWDANDMFRLNAEMYGVKSSYDNSLQEYTVPLTKKNTDEYRKQEAKAMKIAQEIESTSAYQSHIQLENGDEEDRFSAVVRPDGSNANRYLPPQRRKNMPGPKRPGTLPSALTGSAPKPYPVQPTISNPSLGPNHGFSSPHAPPQISSKQSSSPPVQTSNLSPNSVGLPSMATMPMPKELADRIANGEGLEQENIKPMLSELVPPINVAVKSHVLGPPIPQPLPPQSRKDGERKGPKHKGRDDEIEEFKKFSSNFKLSDESKESKDDKDICMSNMEASDESVMLSNKVADLKVSDKNISDDDTTPDIVKTSKLNPNAKEFVLNPNAKSFTPRSMSVTSPHTQLQQQQQQQMQSLPQRMHSQSPVMAMQHAQMMSGMGQPVFATMGPQYVMQATPVSMALTSPFAASLQQAPRIRKVQLMPPRHEISPSLHVAAATGQPILAPNPIHNPSQLTMQYTPPPGMIHAPGPPQQSMAYPQMSYVLGPRVMSPQPVGMVPTSHTVSYCDSAHVNAHLFMSAHHPSAAALSAAHSMQQHQQQQQGGGGGQQHSNPHPPQSHTPVIHPSPSPVHQSPHVNQQSQPPTPTTVMYPGQMSSMQSGHHNHHNSQATMNAHLAHHANFGPQPVVLMQQQAVAHGHPHGTLTTGPHPMHLHSLHSQSHGNQVLPQMTVIPTSTTMAPNSMVTPPFVHHPQGVAHYLKHGVHSNEKRLN